MKNKTIPLMFKLIIIFNFIVTILLFLDKNETTIINNINVQEDTLKNYVIDNLKQSEGLRLKPYNCPANHKSIGYGHVIKKGERFSVIDTTMAELLLLYDFEKAYNLTPINLSYNKRLAIAHFIYGVGYSTYKNSTLYKLIEKQEYIGLELLKFKHYKTKHGYKESNHLLNSRKFELKLYYL